MEPVKEIVSRKIMGENILHYLSQYDKTRADLCKEVGVSYSTLSDWIHGKSYPRIEKIEKMADYFGCSISDLIESSEYNSPARIRVLENPNSKETLEILYAPQDIYLEGEHIGLKIHGDSMAPRLCHGDTVIVKKQATVESGDIVIVTVGGDTICKKIEKDKDGITLIPTNNEYKPTHYSNEDIESGSVKIIGKVVEVRGKI